jgi:hypothetical protein
MCCVLWYVSKYCAVCYGRSGSTVLCALVGQYCVVCSDRLVSIVLCALVGQ